MIRGTVQCLCAQNEVGTIRVSTRFATQLFYFEDDVQQASCSVSRRTDVIHTQKVANAVEAEANGRKR